MILYKVKLDFNLNVTTSSGTLFRLYSVIYKNNQRFLNILNQIPETNISFDQANDRFAYKNIKIRYSYTSPNLRISTQVLNDSVRNLDMSHAEAFSRSTIYGNNINIYVDSSYFMFVYNENPATPYIFSYQVFCIEDSTDSNNVEHYYIHNIQGRNLHVNYFSMNTWTTYSKVGSIQNISNSQINFNISSSYINTYPLNLIPFCTKNKYFNNIYIINTNPQQRYNDEIYIDNDRYIVLIPNKLAVKVMEIKEIYW